MNFQQLSNFQEDDTQENNGSASNYSSGPPHVFMTLSDPEWDNQFESEEEEEEVKKPKKKSLRQIKHEEDLKARGKWKPPIPKTYDERFRTVGNPPISFQAYYVKAPRPLHGIVPVWVTHVESAGMVFLQTDVNRSCCENITKTLQERYENTDGEIPSLPRNCFALGNACVIKHDDGFWYRCRIYGFDPRIGVILLLSDVGTRLPIIPTEQFHRLKVLLTGGALDYGEQAMPCKLSVLCEGVLSSAEKSLMKELLPVGMKLKGRFDRVKPPWRVFLLYGNEETKFQFYFEQELEKRKISSSLLDRRRQVATWRGHNNTQNGNGARNITPEGTGACASICSARAPASTFGFEKEDTDSDRDDTASLVDLNEHQERNVKNWIFFGDQKNVYGPVDNPPLTLDELTMHKDDSEDDMITEEFPCLARSRPNSSSSSSDIILLSNNGK